jgi:hypothetical protein
VSSPNDPGYPGAGDPANGSGPKNNPRSAGSGPLSTTGPMPDSSDPPPWQRGPAARSRPPQRGTADTSGAGGADARTKRFSTGSTAPQPSAEAESPALSRAEAFQSELPDLSGPLPRPPSPRRPPAERSGGEPGPPPPTRASAPTSRIQVATRPRGPLRASMQIRRVDPWTVLKVSLVLSVALFFVWMVAVAFLYLVLGGMGVWSKLNSNVGDLLTNPGNTELVSSGAIFGTAALIGLVNIVLLTAMATVGAFIYNLTTDLVGGVEVTLADRD